jgi:putative SOS response-associated peptidase YedK
MINARAETVAQKPSFKNAFAGRRCLVPADGFYEWKKEGKYKTPFYIYHNSNKPMSFAGLWESWLPKDADASTDTPEEEPLRTFTIITTEANQRLQELHNRMPVIIPADKRERWLDPDANPEELVNMLQPLTSSDIEFHEVSRNVNSPQNNSPQCIEPVSSELS